MHLTKKTIKIITYLAIHRTPGARGKGQRMAAAAA
jgi:hypothetical protein